MVSPFQQEIFPVALSNTGATAAFSVANTVETGRTFYLSGWQYSVLGGATTTTVTITGLSQGETSGITTAYTYYVPATATGNTLSVAYDPDLPSLMSGVISVNASANTGATTCAINVQGYFI